MWPYLDKVCIYVLSVYGKVILKYLFSFIVEKWGKKLLKNIGCKKFFSRKKPYANIPCN